VTAACQALKKDKKPYTCCPYVCVSQTT